jgi:hypothetical protein
MERSADVIDGGRRGSDRGVWRGVFRGVEDGSRPPSLWVAIPETVLCLFQEDVKGSGMAGPSDTLGSPWPPLAIRPCSRMMMPALTRRSLGQESLKWLKQVYMDGMGYLRKLYDNRRLTILRVAIPETAVRAGCP